VTSGLTVSLHRGTDPAPVGWDEFVAAQRLHALWRWDMVRAATADHRVAVLTATIHDGQTMRGIVTARFVGPRARRGTAPLVGAVDVECLVSASFPGIMLESGAEPGLFGAAVSALRGALRQRYGRRYTAMMLRQVPAEVLPEVLLRPAIVREGGPIAVWHNRFDTYDDYLATLSRKRRQSLRAQQRRIEADPELSVTFTGRGDPPGALDVPDMRALNTRVIERHRHRWYLPRRMLLPTVAGTALASPDAHRLTYHDPAGRLLAYGIMWDHPDLPLAAGWGAVSPAEGGPRDLWYHQIILYLRWCIESGRRGLIVGQGDIQAKLPLRFDLQRQWAVLIPHP
jgi:hypothetical protein